MVVVGSWGACLGLGVDVAPAARGGANPLVDHHERALGVRRAELVRLAEARQRGVPDSQGKHVLEF